MENTAHIILVFLFYNDDADRGGRTDYSYCLAKHTRRNIELNRGKTMKRTLVIIAISWLILALTVPDAWAGGRMHGHGFGSHGANCYEYSHHGTGCPETDCYEYSHHGSDFRRADCAEVRTYSGAALETISGELIDTYEATSSQSYRSGLHLLVKTDEDNLDVHLGPIWYLEQENFSLEPGDSLEIKGERLRDSQMPTMIAIEIKKGKELLTLRDEDGFPMWRASLRQ